jgi:hypothetical protein
LLLNFPYLTWMTCSNVLHDILAHLRPPVASSNPFEGLSDAKVSSDRRTVALRKDSLVEALRNNNDVSILLGVPIIKHFVLYIYVKSGQSLIR